MNLGNRSHEDGQESVERSGERAAAEGRRVTDREVPLGPRETSPAVHAWLDGEIPETAVRADDTVRDVEFWKRINTEVDKRRQMRTPPHVYEQIMQSLPNAAPAEQQWWRKHFNLTPLIALVAGGVLLVAGVVFSLMMLRGR